MRGLGWKSALAVGLVIGLAAGGTFAWAAIPDSTTGAVTACYPTGGATKGALRVIDYPAGARCVTGESMLTWPTHGFRWRGLWTTTAAYGANDVVRYNGSAYIALMPSAGITPAKTKYWSLMAAQGTQGAPANAVVEATAPSDVTIAVIPNQSSAPVDLGGPALTTTVPSSGLVDVYGAADLNMNPNPNPSDTFSWAGFEYFLDGTVVGGGSALDHTGHLPQVGAGSWLTVEATPGVHTFSVRYYANSMNNPFTAHFSNRKLWVMNVGA